MKIMKIKLLYSNNCPWELDFIINDILINIEKEIEFFRKIVAIYKIDDKYLRTSLYKIKGKQAFILLEIFYEELLNNFLS